MSIQISKDEQIAAVKLRDRNTGLFSSGGISPRWSKRGKVWTTSGLNQHLSMIRHMKSDKYNPYADCDLEAVVLYYACKENSTYSIII